MINNNKAEPLFEVAIRTTREPLPPCWEVARSNLSATRAIKVSDELKATGKLTLISQQNK